uniref:Uncharacterized protein n=1 Tax=viral metagenome TaxID=1070528 RepID=A0A6C0FCY5_9ZZZZ|tara:strand:+ start:207 stop:425 length:219 start_codon:yes stop_codon:yes gene_type:complete
MKGFHKLEQGCPDGIPFSKCKAYMKKGKKTKRKKKTNRKKRSVKRTQVPPKGVVIRKNDKLYRSDGRTLKLI